MNHSRRTALVLSTLLGGCSSAIPDLNVSNSPRRDDISGRSSSIPATPTWWDDQHGQHKLDRIPQLSDEELRSALQFLSILQSVDVLALEACLVEIQTRGQKSWIPFLKNSFDQLRRQDRFHDGDLEVLMVLRRLQGRPDPLLVEIDNKDPVEALFPEMPVLYVRIRNVDRYSFTISGPSDGVGRAWRLDARDSRNQVALLSRPIITAWGRTDLIDLQPGSTLGLRDVGPQETIRHIPLPVPNHVDFPRPGTYSVVVEYHNHSSSYDRDPFFHVSFDWPPTGKYIFARSRPVNVTWKPRVVQLSAQEQAQIERIVTKLLIEPVVTLFDTRWEPNMRFEGQPQSVAETLYRRGYQTLPVLLEKLKRSPGPRERDHVLAMLASITGLGRLDFFRAHGFTEVAVVSKPDKTTTFKPGQNSFRSPLTEENELELERLVHLWKRLGNFVQRSTPETDHVENHKKRR